jgi:hypothetical protein
MAWINPRDGKIQKHGSADIVAVASGRIVPGLKTTNNRPRTLKILSQLY